MFELRTATFGDEETDMWDGLTFFDEECASCSKRSFFGGFFLKDIGIVLIATNAHSCDVFQPQAIPTDPQKLHRYVVSDQCP